ncbi:hypothetical protein Q5M85_00475 [Paraclostridium bifermentans]|nr:hypothetical protein [Paraclostridium bifermentans]
MQDGSLDLDIDGDLFKVTLKFELLNDGFQLEECSIYISKGSIMLPLIFIYSKVFICSIKSSP